MLGPHVLEGGAEDGGLDGLGGGQTKRLLVHDDSAQLDGGSAAQEEVDRGQQVVLGLDDQTPSGPDEAGGKQSGVLGAGQSLDRSSKVRDTGNDQSPLHDGGPEMDRLGAGLGVKVPGKFRGVCCGHCVLFVLLKVLSGSFCVFVW